MKDINKKKSIVEIIICFSLMLFLTVFVNIFGKDFGLWLGILTYWLSSIILILYILKVEKEPLSSIGLKRICFKNIFEGLGLGVVMFIAQQIRKGQILRPTPNTAPLICGACYNTQPEDLLTMA